MQVFQYAAIFLHYEEQRIAARIDPEVLAARQGEVALVVPCRDVVQGLARSGIDLAGKGEINIIF